jgi:hypothetical protein
MKLSHIVRDIIDKAKEVDYNHLDSNFVNYLHSVGFTIEGLTYCFNFGRAPSSTYVLDDSILVVKFGEDEIKTTLHNKKVRKCNVLRLNPIKEFYESLR